MYHPSRGGVRGGRDQFNWEEVKTDKHRENYLGHSVKAPVGRWQKGKDLTWYAKDNKSDPSADEAVKAEIRKIKEDEEQAMREILGLAPKRERRFQGNRLDKQETAELFRRGKTEEDLAPGYKEGERIEGLGFAPAPRHTSTSKSTSVMQFSHASESPRHLEVLERRDHSTRSLPDDANGNLKKKLERKEEKEKRKEEKRAAKKHKRYEAGGSDDRKRARRRHDSSDESA